MNSSTATTEPVRFSFGDTPELKDSLLALVLAGKKTATCGALRDYGQGGETMPAEEVARRGGNASAIHIDWMIGSDQIDVDGITQSGERVPVMRKGEWA